jgi:hypothetical protein
MNCMTISLQISKTRVLLIVLCSGLQFGDDDALELSPLCESVGLERFG